jgi:hypothetical protein
MTSTENERIYPMPELFSRMDNLNWLTPSIAEILDQGSTPPGGDGSIRERMLIIQHELDDLETPARIVNVRSTPSYTLYTARPETVGRIGNRHTITSNEIKQSIKKIAENHKDWLLGFIPQLGEDETAVGILLRTQEHRPMSLRRLMVRTTFRKHDSTLAFVIGITLEQQLIVENIDSIGHMLIVGGDNAKQHFIKSTLLSLIMLNTPSELRIAIAGESSDAYKYMVGAPHALGRILTSANEGQRIIDGLTKEIQRRKQSFRDEGVSNITDYNKLANQSEKSELPRIVMVLDSLTDPSWKSETKNWINPLSELLIKGAEIGIHLIIAIDDEDNLKLSDDALKGILLKIVMRASSKDISTKIPNFHASLLRFVDAFVFDKIDKKDLDPVPVELCAISNVEIKNVVEYWRQMSKQRYQDIQSAQSSTKTGVTGILTPPPELDRGSSPPPTPPTPEIPSVSVLTKATQTLGTQLATTTAISHSEGKDDKVALVTEEAEIIEPSIQKNSMLREDVVVVVPEVVAMQTEEAEILDLDNKEGSVLSNDSKIIHQSIALAAYLGWISKGALRDIFFVSEKEAGEVIKQLQKQQIIEDANYPTLRFVKIEQSSTGVYQSNQLSIGNTAKVQES